MDKDIVIAELKRVAQSLQVTSLSRSTFKEHGNISAMTVEGTFGSWNEAIKAAGLIPLPQGSLPKSPTKLFHRLQMDIAEQSIAPKISDEAALRELLRLEKELGKRPSTNQVKAKGKYDPGVYKRRWVSIETALTIAKEQYGIEDDSAK